jgi:predicted DNA-binding transcriptional regulator AlpA
MKHSAPVPAFAGAGSVPAGPRLLDERTLAALYGFKCKTLQRWRGEGHGPRWVRLCGLVRYRVEDIEAWISAAPAGGGQG